MKRVTFLLLLAFTTAHLHAQTRTEIPPYKSDTVFISGTIKQSFNLTLDNLHGLQLHTVSNYELRNEHGEVKSRIKNFKGILLKDIIDKCEVEMQHKYQGKYLVVITATDGYTVLFAYNELMYGPAARGVYLAIEADEKPVENGPFVLFTTSDAVNAPRHVKWVKSIEIRKI